MAQAYLGDFCARVDPNYQSAKHTRALCDALEAIERRDIHRLAVFMPPRHGKCVSGDTRVTLWSGEITTMARIREGDVVVGIDGAFRYCPGVVSWKSAPETKPVLRVQLANGDELVGTDEHKVLTFDGWKTIGELTPADDLAVRGGRCDSGVSLPRCPSTGDVDWVPVRSVADAGDAETFDVSIDGPQNFLANDIVTHNSTHVSINFPAWYLGRNPDHQVIITSYGAELAAANSRKVRNLLGSQRYPFSVRVASDSAAANRWATTRGGIVVAAGVEGALAGFGSHCLLADDLVKNPEEADSQLMRDKTWAWWTEVAAIRMMPNGVIVLCGTRWHEDDVYGRVLNSAGGSEWHVLNMPATDPDFTAALWPEWFDLDALKALKEPMSPRRWAALYMQNPQAEEGGMFKRSTFGIRWKEPLPRMNFTVLTIDSAFKTGIMNDYSALALWGMSNQRYFLIHAVHGRWEFPDLIRKITALNSEYHPNVILIEDAASGQSAIQQLKLTRMPIVPYKERGSKESRAEAVTGIFESGRVVLPESAVWLDEWMDEHAGFPTSKHDDFVDTTSMALGYLSKKSGFGGKKLQPLDMRVRMGTRRR